MIATVRLSGLLVLASGLAACSTGSTGAPPITQVNPTSTSYSKLQFAVGTANLEGAGTGLNVVSTLRQPSGQSALGVDTPTLSGPFSLGGVGIAAPASGSLTDPYTTLFNGGPSLAEAAASATITGTPQTINPGTPYCDYVGTLPAGANPSASFQLCPRGYSPDASTFGQSGGVFANGIAPYNSVANTSQSYSYAPYPQPIYGDGSYLPWGGPPAFDPDGDGMGTRDGLITLDHDSFGNPYFLGVAEGVTAFNVAPGTGTYGLTVQVATIGNGGSNNLANLQSSATLKSLAVLPTLAAPVVTPDANGDGGATVPIVLPGGVTEAYVQIVDYGPGAGPVEAAAGGALIAANCQGPKGPSFAPVYYTIEVTRSGTYALPPNAGPNTNATGGANNLTPSPSLCTAAQNSAAGTPDGNGNVVPDNFTVQMVGFDYPAYEMAHSLLLGTVPQAPAIVGSNGQSDLTLSPANETQAVGESVVRRPIGHRRGSLLRQRGARRRATPATAGGWGFGVPRH